MESGFERPEVLPTSYLISQAAAGQLHQSGLPSSGGSMTL